MVVPDLPEIGPYLGRLTDVSRRFEAADVELDRIRLEVVSELFEQMAAARGFLATGDEAGARAALDRVIWTGLWEAAAVRVAEQTMAAVIGRLERAARRVNYPSRRLAPLRPSPDDRSALLAKLEAAAIPLEERLARGFAHDRDWRAGVRQAAVAFEDSWEALEAVVRSELAAANPIVAEIDNWRPSLAPWLVALGAAVMGVGWVGLVLGGYLPTPSWFEGTHAWFWSLPWP